MDDTKSEKPTAYLKFFLQKNPLYQNPMAEEEITNMVEKDYKAEREYYEPGRTYLHSKEELREMIVNTQNEFSQYPFQLGKTAIITAQEDEMIAEVEKREGFERWVWASKEDFIVEEL